MGMSRWGSVWCTPCHAPPTRFTVYAVLPLFECGGFLRDTHQPKVHVFCHFITQDMSNQDLRKDIHQC